MTQRALPTVWFTFCLVSASLLMSGDHQTWAGEYNEVLSIGDALPVWKELPGTDGKLHATSDLADKDVLVVAFTCASCPTAVDYEARLNALVKSHGGPDGKVGFAVFCVNQIPTDQLPALTKRVKDRGLAFEFIQDESQQIAKDFGAIFTPEFFVFNKARQLVYMGALDDSTDADKVSQRHVEVAISAALAGKTPEITETIGRGCRVRYARMRRR